MNRLKATFHLGANTIDSAGSLLQRTRIPAKIVMDDMTAV